MHGLCRKMLPQGAEKHNEKIGAATKAAPIFAYSGYGVS